jgi:hypothetical protein
MVVPLDYCIRGEAWVHPKCILICLWVLLPATVPLNWLRLHVIRTPVPLRLSSELHVCAASCFYCWAKLILIWGSHQSSFLRQQGRCLSCVGLSRERSILLINHNAHTKNHTPRTYIRLHVIRTPVPLRLSSELHVCAASCFYWLRWLKWWRPYCQVIDSYTQILAPCTPLSNFLLG